MFLIISKRYRLRTSDFIIILFLGQSWSAGWVERVKSSYVVGRGCILASSKITVQTDGQRNVLGAKTIYRHSNGRHSSASWPFIQTAGFCDPVANNKSVKQNLQHRHRCLSAVKQIEIRQQMVHAVLSFFLVCLIFLTPKNKLTSTPNAKSGKTNVRVSLVGLNIEFM